MPSQSLNLIDTLKILTITFLGLVSAVCDISSHAEHCEYWVWRSYNNISIHFCVCPMLSIFNVTTPMIENNKNQLNISAPPVTITNV